MLDDFIEKEIYNNGNSKITVEFDGDIVILKQETEEIGKQSIYLYEDELEEIYEFVQQQKEAEEN
ncbi:hypothetical protein [Bacillus smithii]|uniref:hypothetical protein n=1 Tax=Bacillus smithii TaxID=1479 RepID=UPI002E1EF1BF|nr:hypothetical protein [Bacillus smithii]MED4929185.1 hypothetical protein [Bacillus smithii]